MVLDVSHWSPSERGASFYSYKQVVPSNGPVLGESSQDFALRNQLEDVPLEEEIGPARLGFNGRLKYARMPSCLYISKNNGAQAPSTNPPWHLSLPHACVAIISNVLFGYHMAVVNIPLQHIAEDLGFADDYISQGLLVSLLLVGAFFGSALSGLIADGLGRRSAMQLSAFPMLVGTMLSAVATSNKLMLVGRSLVGVGLGIVGPVTSLYVSEISPTYVRGAYGCLCQVATCVGILGALLISLPTVKLYGWWRACFWIAAGPAILLLIGMEFCAESPRWLFKKRRRDDAASELRRLWGEEHMKAAMADLIQQGASIERESSSWGALLEKQNRRVLIIGAALFAFQQFSGINAVFYFSSTVFRNAGFTSAMLASVCVGCVNLLASLIATYLTEKLGRRTLLIFSFLGMMFAMSILASAAAFQIFADLQGQVSVVGILMFVFMFALGAGPIPGLLLSEILADSVRAKAMSVAMSVHWVANFIVGLAFLHFLQQFGPVNVYSFFATVCLAAAYFVKKATIETKGRSLQEIQAILLARG